jgi:ElaB/YqjD/DUF883 family membrane-anchored ribosome-binding protein
MDKVTNDNSSRPNLSLNEFKNKVSSTENDMKRMIYEGSDKFEKTATDMAHKATDSLNKSYEFVQINPVRSVLYAAATGMVVGGLLTALFRSRK